MESVHFIKYWIQHPIINLAYICKKLYGKADNATRAKLYNKISGVQGKRFSQDELTKLEEIRNQILKELEK